MNTADIFYTVATIFMILHLIFVGFIIWYILRSVREF